MIATRQLISATKDSTVLVIATVDSGGGAGVSADCLTIHDLGAFPQPVTCAVTAQSLKQVAMAESLSDEMTKRSMDLILSDWEHKAGAIKIGFIPGQSTLNLILEYLENHFADVPVVWDPVLTATAGKMDSADLKAVLPKILKNTTVFTPNLPEALELSGFSKADLQEQGVEALGRFFLNQGADAVIIKGGHRSEAKSADDVLVTSDATAILSYKKQDGDGAHGGGCALSSALAALLAQDYMIEDAAVLAKAYVTRGILEPVRLMAGHFRPPLGHRGFPCDLKFMPKVKEQGFAPAQDTAFLPCPHRMGLYPVVDSVELIEKLLHYGVRTLQLRVKDKDDPLLFEKIKKAVALGKEYRARVFIDDHYELAIKAGAYGVHLGMEDLKTADLDAIKKAGLRLGVSTHGIYELLKARDLLPSYIALGHIFPTGTKKMKSRPQGLKRLAYQVKLLGGSVPVVAIAGIKLDNVQGVLDAGAGSVAVVTALTQSQNLHEETLKWLSLCGSGEDEGGYEALS